ncbi:hypothetical protein [Pararhizobium sp. PWRC1-1]|uniref:hypothetical protein n=1 Tax=Pararhizobium sp. PWRC1-1 TaxID=2804566 RepID=UPI003CE98AE7
MDATVTGQINHIRHGRALLALRRPELGALPNFACCLSELCEAYTLAVIHLAKLRIGQEAPEAIAEYEDVCSGIENEVYTYLSDYRK